MVSFHNVFSLLENVSDVMILVGIYCSLSLRLIEPNLFIMLAGLEVSFHSFVTSTLNGCECSSPCHCHFASGVVWVGDSAIPELSRLNSTVYRVYTKRCPVNVIFDHIER